MLTTIHITVRSRVPTITEGEEVISHNSDYVIEFDFDEEWQDKVKTVYFVCEDGSYQPIVMSGNSCGVPMMAGEHRRIFVGVQAGSAEKPSVLKTTRPCCLKVKDSIADYLGEQIPDPTPDVYEQIIAMLNNLTTPTWDSVQNKPFSTLGDGLEVDENGVLSAQGGGGGSANAVQYVAQSLTDEQKAQARENIGASPIPTVRYWLKLKADNIINLYNMGVGYGIISPVDYDQTVPTGMSSPMLVIFGGMNYGRVDITVYDGAGAVWRGSLNLSSQTTNVTKTGDYVNKNIGAGNAGKILGIGEDGVVVPQDKPTYTLTDADKTAVADAVVADGIAATLTDLPSGGGGGETWVKLVDTSLAEAVESVTYTFDNCKRIKALIAPAIAKGEVASGWKQITINNIAYPSFNSKLSAYEGICFRIDSEYPPYVQGNLNVITKATTYGFIAGVQVAALENIAPNGVTEFGCQTAALLKAGTKIEIWGVKS